MEDTGDDRQRLLALLRTVAVLRGHFVLASGQSSPYYLDARLVTLSAEGSGLVGSAFLDMMRDREIDAVAGLAIGADPIVAAIAVVSGQRGGGICGLIVRKERKVHGAGRQIEGPWKDGLRVAVVDDTLTTGTSALEAARAVEQAGGQVHGVYALIDREQGARQRIEAAGHTFAALFTASELL